MVAFAAQTCANGEYLSGTECVQCDAGFYCTNDTRLFCPDGTYSTAGQSECTPVDTGYYGTDCGNFDDYTQLEYIEGTGKQWINTEYYVQLNDEIGITGQRTEERFGGYGNCFSTSGTYFLLMSYGQQASTRFGNNVRDTFALPTPIEEYIDFTAINNKTNLTINGEVVYTYGNKGFYTPTEPTYLLRHVCPSKVTRPGLIKRWWVMRDGKLFRNMIPARRNSDGAIGMFDTVEYKFYENAGSGTFVAGPSVHNGCASQTICPTGSYCANGLRRNCVNAPEYSAYTDTGWTTANCPWVCTDNRVKTAINTCGRLCTAGVTTLNTSSGITVPIFAEKNTSPSIYIQTPTNMTCYVDLIPGTSQKELHVDYQDTTYHTVRTPTSAE